MSSLDMDAYFNTVAHQNLPQHLYTGCQVPAEDSALPEVLNASELDTLAAPILDPFHEEQALYKSVGQVIIKQDPQQVLPAHARLSARLSGDIAHSSELAQSHCIAESASLSSNKEQQEILSTAATQSPADIVPAHSRAHESQTSAITSLQAETNLCGSQLGDTNGNSSGGKLSKAGVNTFDVDTDSERHIRQDISQSVETKTQPVNADRTHPQPFVLANSWPRMTHVPKLRHGEQLRKAAVEAATAAAGQAARAESAVRLQTPPTIAFHSKAAQHAMAAAEAAAVSAGQISAALCPGQRAGRFGAQSAVELEEGHSLVGQLHVPAPRAGRLHASAPASPKHPSLPLHRACQSLWGNTGNHADEGVDFAAVNVSGDHGCYHASDGQPMDPLEQPNAGLSPLAFSAPSSPVSSHKAVRLFRQQQQQQLALLSCNCLHQKQQLSTLSAICTHRQRQQERPESKKGKARDSDGAEQSRHWQQPQHAQHGLETLLPIEDPFKASDQFPVCPELSLWRPGSTEQVKQYDLLAECTNQLAGIQDKQPQHLRLPVKSRTKQRQHRPKPEAATAVRPRCSTAAQADSCTHLHRRVFGHALSNHIGDRAQPACKTHIVDRAQPASELSSLTENEFWEAAREDLLDTAEAVRHQSRVAQLTALTPVRMQQLSLYASGQEQTPLPRLQAALTHQSGITPLLGKIVPNHGSKCALLCFCFASILKDWEPLLALYKKLDFAFVLHTSCT